MIRICSIEAKSTQREDLEILNIFGGNNFVPNFPKDPGPEPRAREMAEFSLRYLRCHDYVSSDPDKRNTCWITIQRQDETVLCCCFFKSNKKEEINGDELVFVPVKKATHQDGSGVSFRWEDIHIFKLIVVQKVFGFKSPITGGRSSTLASDLHACICKGYIFDVFNLRPF